MKRILFSIVLSCVAILGIRSQGIVFETGAFADVMAKAEAQNKPVFVDFYTDWCGPCKKMTLDVFTQKQVGELFNANFISYKIDAEKGEGVEIAKKYGVQAFPTMIWLNAKGKMLHKIVGARSMEKLLDEANIMIKSKDAGGLEEMKKKFESGSNDVEFLFEFHELFPKGDKMRPAVALRYLNALPDSTLFDQQDDQQIVKTEKMIAELHTFDADLFYRIVNGIVKVGKEKKLSANYNLAVVFATEQKVGELMEKAIKEKDELFLEELIRYKEYWPTGITKNVDPDWDLIYGRGLFFASSDFIRLEYQYTNELEEPFRKEMISYMDRLLKDAPKGEWVTPHFDVKLLIEILKDMAQKGAGRPNLSSTIQMRASSLFKLRARSIDYFVKWVEYFWRISPSDQETKEQIARWLDYVVAINPYYVRGTLNSTPLLVKVGKKDLAIDHIEQAIHAFKEIALGESDEVKKLESLLRDVKNDKVY